MGKAERLARRKARRDARNKTETITIKSAPAPTTSSIKSIDYGTKDTTRTGGTTVVATSTPSRSGSSGGSRTSISSVGQTPSSSPSVQRAVTQTQASVQSTQRAIQQRQRALIITSNTQQRKSNPVLNRQDRFRKRTSDVLRFPEKKIIEPALQKVRETEGTQLVGSVGFNPFGVGGFGLIGVEPKVVSNLRGSQAVVETPFNVAGAIDIGSFFIPVVGQARAVTFVSKVGGEVIDNPRFVIEQPLQVAGAVLIGAGGIVSSSSKVASKIKVGDIAKLQAKDLQFIQQVDKGTGKLNFFGQRTSGGLKQMISVEGKLTKLKPKDPKISSNLFRGAGASSTFGEFSTVLGLPSRSVASLQTFKVFGKGTAKEIGALGKIPIFGQFGATGVRPIASITDVGRKTFVETGGEGVLDFSTGVVFQLTKKSALSLGKGNLGVSVTTSEGKASKFIAGKSGTSSVKSIQESGLELGGNLQKITPKIDPVKTNNFPSFRGITGIVKAEEFKTPSLVQPVARQPTVIISDSVVNQVPQTIPITQPPISVQTPQTSTKKKSGRSQRSRQGTKQIPIQATIPIQTTTTKTPTKTIPILLKNPIRPTVPAIIPITPRLPRTPRVPRKLPKFKIQSSTQKGSGLFGVSVRRYGTFRPVGNSIAVGQSIVSSGLGATFKVSGRGSKGIRTPKGFKRKVTNEGVLFIEERKNRLSTKGEKVEIATAKRRKKK